MRDNFNMLPIVQDNMNYMAGVRGLSNISSNGYYGYQATPTAHQMEKNRQELAGQNAEMCQMEVQFESLPPQTRFINRKRCWEFSNDFREFKKRRQNESISFTYHQQPTTEPSNRDANLRKPTHNIPDMPRCIMGHYI